MTADGAKQDRFSSDGTEEVTAADPVAAVLVHRFCSYYLPPIWGWLSLRWLTNRDHL